MLTISKLGATLFDISLFKTAVFEVYIWHSSRVEKLCFFQVMAAFFVFMGEYDQKGVRQPYRE